MARQAIVTRYHGSGNRIGSRISATAAAGRYYIPYNHGMTLEQNHVTAMRHFRNNLKWTPAYGRYVPHEQVVTGVLPNGDYVHVTPDTL